MNDITNNESKVYTLDVLDAEDGSGDRVLQFTEEFLKDNGWQFEDEILFKVQEDGNVTMRNISKEKREGKL